MQLLNCYRINEIEKPAETLYKLETVEMVTLMPRLPLSEKSWAMLGSKTRQSELWMAVETPSCIDLGVAS